jgi:hypothetical protein
VNLATSSITGIPPAFSLPLQKEQFIQHARENPSKMWIQKSNKHRGIKIKTMQELDLTADQTFIQEYISKPFLVDGRFVYHSFYQHIFCRKFDIGIYTVITSITPLRVYVFDGEALLRFCPQDYHPFDPNIVDKYVIGDDYTPTWEVCCLILFFHRFLWLQMPSLKRYHVNMTYTFKESLNAHIRQLGRDPNPMWAQIHDTIRQVFRAKIGDIRLLSEKYKYSWFVKFGICTLIVL